CRKNQGGPLLARPGVLITYECEVKQSGLQALHYVGSARRGLRGCDHRMIVSIDMEQSVLRRTSRAGNARVLEDNRAASRSKQRVVRMDVANRRASPAGAGS